MNTEIPVIPSSEIALARIGAGKIRTVFRVLYSTEHVTEWAMTAVPNSSHHRPPAQWIYKWDGTHNAENPDENYPLLSFDFGKWVRFTTRAREVFLAAPDKFTPEFFRDHWESEEAYEVGQLAGICAFMSPQACLDWVETDPILRSRKHEFQYVIFNGIIISEAPETAGIVAQLEEKFGTPMTLDQFVATYFRTLVEE